MQLSLLGAYAVAASACPLTETVLSLLDTAEASLQRSGWGFLGVRNTKCRKLEQQWCVHESKDSAATISAGMEPGRAKGHQSPSRSPRT